MCASVSECHVSAGALPVQKRVFDPLELELDIVSCLAWVLWKSQSWRLTVGPFLQLISSDPQPVCFVLMAFNRFFPLRSR